MIVAASGAQRNALRGLLALNATGAVLVLGGGGLLLADYENRPAASTLSARPVGASESPQSPDPDIGRVSSSSTGSCDQNGVPVSQPTGTAVRRDGQRCGWSASAAPPPIGDNHPYYDYECSTFNVPSSPPADTTTQPSGGTTGPPAAAKLCHGKQACGGYDNDPRDGPSCGDSATAHLARVRAINLSCTEAKRIAADVAPTTSGADGFSCNQTPEGDSPTYVCRLPGFRSCHPPPPGHPERNSVHALGNDHRAALAALRSRHRRQPRCWPTGSDATSRPAGRADPGLRGRVTGTANSSPATRTVRGRSPAPSGPGESPGFLLWQTTLRWQRAVSAALAPYELTHVQFVLLTSAWWLEQRLEAPTQRQLADHAATDAMMTSQVLRALEAKTLITRTPDPRDTRAKRVRLTHAGQARVGAALSAVEAVDEHFFQPVPRQELTSILHALVTMKTSDEGSSR